ncbi:uncharacterized protein LOC127847478 isoform X4 [Dreissena polymorpha]|nr:uncharacterized protein LOC127847478 isoform X4 [Dreissena polymorpha]
MKYIDNSSERHDSFFRYATEEERWADAAFMYIRRLDCSDATDAFFTTKRECGNLVTIPREEMNVYLAPPSMFGYKYKTFLPDEPLSRGASHDGVLVIDPYPRANFGHLVLVFHIDTSVSPSDCYDMEGQILGHQQCLTLALRKRCKNALERRSKRRNFARRCEINFLPVVQYDTGGQPSAATSYSSPDAVQPAADAIGFESFPSKRENHLECRSGFAGFGKCPDIRSVEETSELICNPIRDNTQRCSTTHETVHTSCRMFEICDQAVILSGGWNRITSGRRHQRNVELFYWMLRENGFKRRNIKVFFANGATGVHMPGEHPHQVLPAAMKLAFRYHVQTMCRTVHCVDSLLIYMNSPTKTDGTSLLWDVNGDGMAEAGEQYTVEELQDDLASCAARKVHLVIDQSYSGEIAQVFKNSPVHENVIVFASGKDHEYSYDDEFTLHWVRANHRKDCTRKIHQDSAKEVKGSSPVMREGDQGTIQSTIFGAPCDVTPEFSEQELRENYLGCQNLPTAEWLKVLASSKGD